ncbi:MAG: thiamine-phosphate kinase [Desulfobacteraceae bacterium]|nr:MAG: thiamine-phosphate kinase [Desulfobacteraceae bacterium]
MEIKNSVMDEFRLIRRLIASSKSSYPDSKGFIKVPPGDDACLLSTIKRPVITTDTQREGVHFNRKWLTPEEIGLKAVTVTLSDLAASYARPVSLFINMGLPLSFSSEEAEDIYRGVGIGLQKYGCTLGGGNLSDSDHLSLDLFAIGEGHDFIFPLRSLAKPGDGLFCTGPLGLARAGLEALQQNHPHDQNLISFFKSPVARFDASEILANHKVLCVIDISDGLKGDSMHIAQASGVTIELAIDQKDIDPQLISFCSERGIPAQEFAIASGEDYELLFSCPPETFRNIKKEIPKAYPVGKCLPFTGKHMIAPPSALSSFQHGKK